ncbi:hypothetical protein LCGC14_1832610 [marine sediment metagenome]|uniref:Uncharacterized protein n=1 Tax=marine sediment metagenome TaxID=412755 RepID=A0A0F9JF46_9ZZZZ
MIAEMLKDRYMLLGEERNRGDILTEDDLQQIDEPILRSLEDTKIIRILQNTNSDVINDLTERIEKLEIEVFAANIGDK